MECLTPLLKTDGLLYVEVPDAVAYTEYLYAPFQDFNTEHINHFSRGLSAPWRVNTGSARCLNPRR